jgi:DNA-binding NarL/FixJ family response regulator
MVEKMILAVAGQPATPPPPPAPGPAALAHAEPLTPRERDVMTLLATGRTICEIADALAIGGKTVRNNLSNIYRKLGVRRQAEALIRWFSLIEAQPGT